MSTLFWIKKTPFYCLKRDYFTNEELKSIDEKKHSAFRGSKTPNTFLYLADKLE